MKIAIVHDWLNQKNGGAEAVLFKLAKMYPNADIYTLIYNPKKFDKFLGDRNIITSRLQKFPKYFKKRPKLILPFIKRSVQKWNFENYDLVISSSTAWVKNININEGKKHICYCHSPARMLWDSWPKYINDQNLNSFLKIYVINLVSKLRLWDFYQSDKTSFIANSKYISGRISKFYKKQSSVVYPPVELSKLKKNDNKKDFYLILSVLSRYKNIELAVNAFKDSGKSLVIAGDGPDLERLKKLAASHKNILFLGRVSESKKIDLLANAKGFIFCNVEDFGITMVESIASGTGVIALSGGGADEIIKTGSTGVFYDIPNEESLNRAILDYEKTVLKHKTFSNDYVYEKFSSENFETKMRRLIDEK